jgi:AraC-like DNA-binding protein
LNERRVERAQHLLRADGELGLVDGALRVGFSDQSKFSFTSSGSSASRRDSFGFAQDERSSDLSGGQKKQPVSPTKKRPLFKMNESKQTVFELFSPKKPQNSPA